MATTPDFHIFWVWIGLLAFPIFFTRWGWRTVVIPILLPTLAFAIRSFVVLFWIGFAQMILWTPFAYRTWGFTMFHLIYKYRAPEFEAQRFFYEYERDHTYNGYYEENWRHWHNQQPIDIHWSWSPDSVYHWLPTWTVLIPFAVLFWAIYRKARRWKAARAAALARPAEPAPSRAVVEATPARRRTASAEGSLRLGKASARAALDDEPVAEASPPTEGGVAGPVMRYFRVDGPADEEGTFARMEKVTVDQAVCAVRESKEKGLTIGLYLSRSWADEFRKNGPDICLYFKDGKYTHFGLGPSDDEPFSWMWHLIRFINRFRGLDVSRSDGFIKTVFLIANAGFIGTD